MAVYLRITISDTGEKKQDEIWCYRNIVYSNISGMHPIKISL